MNTRIRSTMLAILLFVSFSSHAVIPEEINFQSKLNLSGGVIFNGTITLTLRLYDDANKTNAVEWTEVHTPVDVIDSVYSVSLGSVTPFPVDLFDKPMFMEIEIERLTPTAVAAETLAPLLPFRSVAYAFFADKAGSIADAAVGSAAISDSSIESIDLADDAITSDKIVNGGVATDDLADGVVTSAKIGDGEIAAVDMAADSVSSTAILDGTVATVDVAPGAITVEKMADAAVGTNQIANGAILSSKILDGAIATVDMADGAITNAKLSGGGGAGSGIDSDLLDGKDSGAFLELSASQTVSGNPKFQSGITFNDDTIQTTAAQSPPAGGDTVSIAVDCSAAETITDALANALPGGLLEITVSGTCNEDVFIARDHVIIKGDGVGPNPSIVGQTAGTFIGAVNVQDFQEIQIENVNVVAATGQDALGVNVRGAGSVSISDSSIAGGYAGIFVKNTGFANLFNVAISGVAHYGVLLIDGGSSVIEQSNISVDLPLSNDFDEYAIGMFRGTALRLKGDNVISNTGAAPGDRYAISVYQHGQFRQDQGRTTITGNIELGNLTNARLGDAAIIGDIAIRSLSKLDLRDPSAPSLPAATVLGNIDISDGGVLRTTDDVIIDGDITSYTNATANLGSNNAITGSVQINGGVLSLGDGTTIDGEVSLRQSHFGGADGVELTGGFTATMSDVDLRGAGATYSGPIRFDGYSNVYIANDLTQLDAFDCASSRVNMADGTTFDPTVANPGDPVLNGDECNFFSGNSSIITGDIFVDNGSSLNFDSSSIVTGNIVLSRSQMRMEAGTYEGELNLELNSVVRIEGATAVTGNVQAFASQLILGTTASVNGNLNLNDRSVLTTFDDNGTPGSNNITGTIGLDNSTANITNNLTLGEEFDASIFVANGSLLKIGSGLTWNLPGEIRAEFGSHVDVQGFGAGTTLNRNSGGATTSIISIGKNSTVRLDNDAALTGDIFMDAGTSLQMLDNVSITGFISAGSHADIDFFGSGGIVTVDIVCSGTEGIVIGAAPVLTSGGSATPISGCDDRTTP